jgi:hypothetical protein
MLPHDGPADEFTVMLRLPVCESGVGVLESTTWTDKAALPALVGVPLIAPAAERVNPVGKEVPFTKLKVYGVTPPAAVRVAEYAVFKVALGSVVVVRVTAGPLDTLVMLSVSVAWAVCGGAEESVTTKFNE